MVTEMAMERAMGMAMGTVKEREEETVQGKEKELETG